jgi:hypothetical protein
VKRALTAIDTPGGLAVNSELEEKSKRIRVGGVRCGRVYCDSAQQARTRGCVAMEIGT